MTKMVAVNSVLNEAIAEEKLVNLWPDFPCLYDVRSAEFKDRDKRQKALEDLGKAVNENVDWVKNKLRVLRNCYTKAKKAPPSGSARRNPSKRTTWVLEKLQFLEQYVATRSTTSNLNEAGSLTVEDSSDNDDGKEDYPLLLGGNDSDDNLLTASNSAVTPPVKSTNMPLQPRVKSMKKKLQEEEFNVMKGLAVSIARDNKKGKVEVGECESYGQFLSESLKKMHESTRHIAQFHINNVVFQAQMGMLTQNQPHLAPPQQEHYSLQQSQYISQQPQYLPQQQRYMPFGDLSKR